MLLLLLSHALAVPLQDTPIQALTLRFDTRYDVIDWGADENRLQNSALVAFQVDLFAGVDLAGMASTGPRFQSRWSTWRDLNGEEPERMALLPRQLYLERWFADDVRIQAGSVPPVKGDVSTSGLEDIGWIDGIRAELHRPSGFVIEGVGGSLTDVDEPDLFIRERRLDYAELETGHPLPAGFEWESAYHWIGGGHYLQAEAGWSGEAADGRAGELRIEGAIELATGATQAVVGGRTDLGVLITGNPTWEDRLELRAHCRWVDPDYGLFGTLAEDFYQFGTECRVRLDGDFDTAGRLGWNLRYIAPIGPGLAPRFDAVLSARLKLRRTED